jgi:hypothetical protein
LTPPYPEPIICRLHSGEDIHQGDLSCRP